MLNATRSTAPDTEPLTTAEAKSHLRVSISTDDTLIDALVTAAREYVEERCSIALYTQTWQRRLDAWPAGNTIRLPRPPLQSVSSVKYYDADGTEYTLASSNYIVDTTAWPGRIVLKSTAAWPSVTLQDANGIVIEYVCGWDDTVDIPQNIKQALLLLVGHWYENREAVLTSGAAPLALKEGVDALLSSYRLRWEFG